MNVRAAAVILTDTKSLSRFSIMKFSSVNVQSSSVFPLPLLSLRGTLAFPEILSPTKFARLASLSHTCTVCVCMSINICACTQTHWHTHLQRHKQRSRQKRESRPALTFHFASSWWGHLLCYIWTHLLISAAAEERRGPHEYKATYRTMSGYFSVDVPEEINILRKCQCHVLASEHWNTTICLIHELTVLSLHHEALNFNKTFLIIT